MIRILDDKAFDLEKVIKKSRKKVISKKQWDKKREINYIIKKFIEDTKLNITKKDLEKAIIKTREVTKSKQSKPNGNSVKGKKVTKDFYILIKEQVMAIKQTTLTATSLIMTYYQEKYLY